jgi:hypothetical protein
MPSTNRRIAGQAKAAAGSAHAQPARPKSVLRPSVAGYTRCKSGFREDLGIFVRSAWEANYARYLNLLKKLGVVVEWEYEPETFWFESIKRGVRSYKPDFRVLYKGDTERVRVEVKGYMDAKSKTKLKRMAKYHPHIKIEIVSGKEYRALQAKWRSAIPAWE